jgi:micrococcal nuclease
MKFLRISVFLIIVFFLAVSFVIILKYNPENTSQYSDNTVVKIIDGDTFQLNSGEIVRLLCVDTLEVGQIGYESAIDFLAGLIFNKEVILEKDIQDKDIYNRSLRYVYINSTNNSQIFVNKELYENGYAKMLIIPPSDNKCDEIGYLI